MPRYYTPSEANQALGTVSALVEEMMRLGESIRAKQPELWAVAQKSAGNGGNPELSRTLKEFDRLDALLHQVQDMGIQVKDLTIGLIDFTAIRFGREVFLCWKYGEPHVEFWHEIEDGFAGRRPVDWQ